MTGFLMLICLIVTIFVTALLMRNINNENSKKVKYTILIGPFLLSVVLYFAIFLLTESMSTGTCDGALSMGLFISFLFLGMGVVFNLLNIVYSIIVHKK